MIVADQISKRFGRTQAVRDVSFTLEDGQIAGLLGPNGAGKSTSIRMVTGFLCPDRGRVSIGGFDTISAPGPARQKLGYLPEAAPCYPEMRAIDYLVYRATLQGLARKQAKKAAVQAAEQCRLDPSMSRKRIGALSKGYRQRVGLAATLVHDPSVLILDEPTNGLDPAQIRDARSLIRELAQDRTMLISSHILPEIERTCDRVIIMVAGQIRADGSPADLAAKLPHTLRIEFQSISKTDPLTPGIEQISGLSGLEVTVTPDGWRSIHARCTPHARDEVSRLVGATPVQVRTLVADPPSLEDVFVQATEQLPESDGGVRS
jgi:gliding motility-associated transport system ATP-binding protein